MVVEGGEKTFGEPIDVILLTHGRLSDLTVPCVRALYAHTKNLFHLIVVDDSTPDMDEGTDKTPQWFKTLQIDQANTTFIHSYEPYKSGNQVINIGLAAGNSRLVAVLGNSTIVEPEWDITPIRMMQRQPKIGVIGMKCLKAGWSPEQDGQIESAGIYMNGYVPCDMGRDEPGHRLTKVYPCFSVQWSFVLLRREAVVANLEEGILEGNLDSDLWQGFVGWDDIDNSVYLRYKGWEAWYCGISAGYHKTHATRGSDSDEVLLKNRINGEIFMKRWGYWDKFKELNPYAPERFPNGEVKYLCDADSLPLKVTDTSFQHAYGISSSLDHLDAGEITTLSRKVAKPGAVFVEVGSWTGYSASIIAQVARAYGGHLYCVDHWKGSEKTPTAKIAKEIDTYKIFERNIRRIGLRDYITPMVMDSNSASEKFKDTSIDFLFIDGDHRYQQFKEDLDNWLPKMKAGGVICGHDCEAYYSKLPLEEKRKIDCWLMEDFTEIYHPGVIRGLFDKFDDNYTLIPNTRIWYKDISNAGEPVKVGIINDGACYNKPLEVMEDKSKLIPPQGGSRSTK